MSSESSRAETAAEPPPRKPISKRLRFEIFRRDNFTCRYCGKHAGEDGAELTIDHVVTVALGGTDDPTNLVTACKDCNAGKSSVTADAALVQDVAQDAMRWARAMEIAAARQHDQDDTSLAYFSAACDLWDRYIPSYVGIPLSYESSCDTFRKQGVTLAQFERALANASGKPGLEKRQIWRYACGIIWSELRERQEIAAEIIASGEV